MFAGVRGPGRADRANPCMTASRSCTLLPCLGTHVILEGQMTNMTVRAAAMMVSIVACRPEISVVLPDHPSAETVIVGAKRTQGVEVYALDAQGTPSGD